MSLPYKGLYAATLLHIIFFAAGDGPSSLIGPDKKENTHFVLTNLPHCDNFKKIMNLLKIL